MILLMLKGVEDMESYNLTEAKAKLSAIISRVVFAHKKITIKKNGRNVAVVMPYEDYVQKWAKTGGSGGLLSAKGALADMEEIDQFVKDIYNAREKSMERIVTGV